jgi:3-deoxy-manno-octulosonate cytidylyltransferase (CMP-KDO synthetase)
MQVIGIIPARFGATRLPGKPLEEIKGKPMIEHVWRQASRAQCLSRLLVATDDQRIFDRVLEFGGEAVMTPMECSSGTDRVAVVAEKLNCDIVVNIQGDEPFLPRTYVDKLVEPLLNDKKLQMSTLAAPMPEAELKDPNSVKVVCDQQDNALYFSRAPIPYSRDENVDPKTHYPRLHIGLYAYRRKFLLEFAKMTQTPLEQIEKLEQLRALENGVKIRVVSVSKPILSIDTPQDLARANKRIKKKT